jgi:hypothetical protein
MAKKKTQAQKPMCQTCAKTFDGVEAAKAAREGRAFIHECGRVLVRERSGGNAEVLPDYSKPPGHPKFNTSTRDE